MTNEEKILELLEKHGELLAEVRSDVSGLKEDVSGLKQDVSGLKQDVSGLKQDVSSLKQDVSGLKEKVSELDSRSKRTAVLLETEYRDKLQLLFDGHKLLNDKLDKLAPKTQVEALSDEVSFLRATVIAMDKRLEALEKAQ